MKIRIKDNTVRFRLVKKEVKQLSELGWVEEKTEFPENNFMYRLEAKEGIQELQAQFVDDKITLFLPSQEAKIWNDTDKITYKNSFGNLLLILEKDFVCLDHTDEDQSDNYANPNSSC
ncbi:MAG: hypothetical protein JNL75_02140 [Chitinophagales bacterium]|nr:hypothetical protein [Chitinophagales bacterium]